MQIFIKFVTLIYLHFSTNPNLQPYKNKRARIQFQLKIKEHNQKKALLNFLIYIVREVYDNLFFILPFSGISLGPQYQLLHSGYMRREKSWALIQIPLSVGTVEMERRHVTNRLNGLWSTKEWKSHHKAVFLFVCEAVFLRATEDLYKSWQLHLLMLCNSTTRCVHHLCFVGSIFIAVSLGST